MAFLGELAALATSLMFSATSTQFTLAGRQTGALVVNRTRLVLATVFLTLAHLLFGVPLPLHAGGERWLWLAISGIIGLVIGDAFLFQAFIWIGPRLSMLLMSLAPIIATLVAWIFLGERLAAWQIAGILVTLSGIAWVILERNGQGTHGADRPDFARGVLFGIGAAAGQALGLIFAKLGASGDFPALTGTLMRMVSAAVLLWAYTLFAGQAADTLHRLRSHPRAVLFILGGSLTGPFLGVTLSLLAIQHTAVGVASTLMALPPVFLLPISRLVFGESFGWQAIAGTLVAMAGVALLFIA